MNLFRLLPLIACAISAVAADYATYIGDAYSYTVTAIAADSSGNTYATGYRTVVVSSAGNTANDVFVTKIDPSGTVTLLATLSGKGSDQAFGIAVDPAGNIYVAGHTTSPDFPLLNPLQSSAGRDPGTFAGFLTKLATTGSIIYSTYLGGTQGSDLRAVAVDSQGNAYVTGSTSSPDYPFTLGLPHDLASATPGASVSVAFFARISPRGDRVVYAGGIGGAQHACTGGSTCLTSGISNEGVAIAVDPAGNAYIAGNTYGGGWPATPGALNGAGIGAFVFRVNAAGSALAYATLLGAANYVTPVGSSTNSAPGNIVNAIAVDAAGNAYLTGWTADPNFPATAGAFQSRPNFTVPAANPFLMPPWDAFVAKLNPSGTAMVWASFLGGSGMDEGTRIALDASNNVWVTGTTESPDFPAASGFPAGGEFLAAFNPSGAALSDSTRLPSGSAQAGLAVESSGSVHLAGATGVVSTLTPGLASDPRVFGVANAAAGPLAGRVAPSELVSIYGLHLGVPAPLSASVDSSRFLPSMLGGVSVTIGGIAAPLLYVSDTQINAVVPSQLALRSNVTMQVSTGALSLPPFRLGVDQAIPGVFLQPNGTAAAANQDGTVNSADNPAPSGSIVSVWATGAGEAPGANGQIASAAQQTCSCTVEELGGITSVSPPYAGVAPGMVNGVIQINLSVTAGSAPVVGYALVVDGRASNVFRIYVQ